MSGAIIAAGGGHTNYKHWIYNKEELIFMRATQLILISKNYCFHKLSGGQRKKLSNFRFVFGLDFGVFLQSLHDLKLFTVKDELKGWEDLSVGELG